jgi:hypothetical protein
MEKKKEKTAHVLTPHLAGGTKFILLSFDWN